MSFRRQSPVLTHICRKSLLITYILRINSHATRCRIRDKLNRKKKERLNHKSPIVGDSSHNSDVLFGSCKILRLHDACTLYSAIVTSGIREDRQETNNYDIKVKEEQDNNVHLSQLSRFCMNQLINYTRGTLLRLANRDMDQIHFSFLSFFLLYRFNTDNGKSDTAYI